MSTYIYIAVHADQFDSAADILVAAGIGIRRPLTIRDDDPNRCKVVEYRRMYDLTTISSMTFPDSMVEHETRRAADAWRAALRELVVEAVV